MVTVLYFVLQWVAIATRLLEVSVLCSYLAIPTYGKS